jgi:hypothetical protein
MIDELEKIWKVMLASKLKYYLDMYLDGLRTLTKTFQNSQCPIQNEHLLNRSLEHYQ